MRNAPWLAKNSHLARTWRNSPRFSWSWILLTQRLLVDVAQDVGGLGQAPQGGERLGDPVGRARIGQALHDDVCCGQAVFERGGDAHELVPLLDDERSIDRIAEQGLERPIVGTAVDPVEHLVRQVSIRGMKSIPSKAQRPHNCSVNPPVSVVCSRILRRVSLSRMPLRT